VHRQDQTKSIIARSAAKDNGYKNACILCETLAIFALKMVDRIKCKENRPIAKFYNRAIIIVIARYIE
jgi:hypothetical protein